MLFSSRLGGQIEMIQQFSIDIFYIIYHLWNILKVFTQDQEKTFSPTHTTYENSAETIYTTSVFVLTHFSQFLQMLMVSPLLIPNICLSWVINFLTHTCISLLSFIICFQPNQLLSVHKTDTEIKKIPYC